MCIHTYPFFARYGVLFPMVKLLWRKERANKVIRQDFSLFVPSAHPCTHTREPILQNTRVRSTEEKRGKNIGKMRPNRLRWQKRCKLDLWGKHPAVRSGLHGAETTISLFPRFLSILFLQVYSNITKDDSPRSAALLERGFLNQPRDSP